MKDTINTTTTIVFDWVDALKILLGFRVNLQTRTEVEFIQDDKGGLKYSRTKDLGDRLWLWHSWERKKPVILQNSEQPAPSTPRTGEKEGE